MVVLVTEIVLLGIMGVLLHHKESSLGDMDLPMDGE